MKSPQFSLAVVTFSILAAALPADSQVLIQHTGATNPASEGFDFLGYGSPQLGPVLNDSGVDAWSIDILNSDAAQYSHRLSTSEQAMLVGSDWELTYKLRILQAPAEPSYDISSRFHTGTEMYSLYFGLASNGDPIVQVRQNSLMLSPAIVLTGAGSTYNTYSLIYHAATDSADLWANGTELYSGMTAPHWTAVPIFNWSGYQHANDVHANWALVSLAIVPEPSVASLAAYGLVLLFHMRRRVGSAS